MTPSWVMHRGDALWVLKDLPTASVDSLITDPPYSSGGMFRGDRQQDVHTKYVIGDSVAGNALEAFSGDSRDQRAYAYWVALWLAESLRIVKPGGVCALFTDWRQLPSTTDALQAGGWVWRGVVPWHKPSGRPVQGRWGNTCEYVVWGTNGPRDLLALDGKALPGFYQANSHAALPGRGHDTTHPRSDAMNGRWFWRMSLEAICAIGAFWSALRVAVDLVTGHWWWALVWGLVCAGNVWAARVHHADRILIEERLDREARRG